MGAGDVPAGEKRGLWRRGVATSQRSFGSRAISQETPCFATPDHSGCALVGERGDLRVPLAGDEGTAETPVRASASLTPTDRETAAGAQRHDVVGSHVFSGARDGPQPTQVREAKAVNPRAWSRMSPKRPMAVPGTPYRASGPITILVGMDVLIIDDDRAVREALAKGLRQAGFEVTTVENGLAALAAIRMQSFVAIACDVKMGFLDGVRLYHELEDEYPELTERFFFISGVADDPGIGVAVRQTGRPC